MAVRSRRLFGPTVHSGASTNSVYTVPALRTAVVTYLNVFLSGAGTGNVLLRLNSTTGGTQHLTSYGGGAQTLRWMEDARLNPGDELFIVLPASVSSTITGYGGLLDGEPV